MCRWRLAVVTRTIPTKQECRSEHSTWSEYSPRTASGLLSAEQHWTTADLIGITTPALVMVGDHDVISVEQAKRTHATIPGSQLAVIPGAPHQLLYLALDIITPVLHRFLDRSRVMS